MSLKPTKVWTEMFMVAENPKPPHHVSKLRIDHWCPTETAIPITTVWELEDGSFFYKKTYERKFGHYGFRLEDLIKLCEQLNGFFYKNEASFSFYNGQDDGYRASVKATGYVLANEAQAEEIRQKYQEYKDKVEANKQHYLERNVGKAIETLREHAPELLAEKKENL